jgi:hypothetical protein
VSVEDMKVLDMPPVETEVDVVDILHTNHLVPAGSKLPGNIVVGAAVENFVQLCLTGHMEAVAAARMQVVEASHTQVVVETVRWSTAGN